MEYDKEKVGKTMFEDYITMLTIVCGFSALLIVAFRQKKKGQPWTSKDMMTFGSIMFLVFLFALFFWFVSTL